MARVVVVTTGGTIASRTDPATGASVPADSAADLLAAVPALADVAEIAAEEHALVSSWDVTPQTMVALSRRIRRICADDPPDGIVVTHGTDTMEETAYVLELLLDRDVPVVLTGAMRSADRPDADGPDNLVDAVRVAASGATRGAGPVVVMHGEVHAARSVTKAHATATDAFASPDSGPIGEVAGGEVRVTRRPAPPPALPDREADPDPAVELVTMVAGLEPRALERAAADGVRGLVLAGSGSGNVHGACVPALRALVEAGVPVVLATRCHAGSVTPTYGGAGGGATLLALGCVPAGDLAPWKARLALMLLLGGGASPADVGRWFAEAARPAP